MNAVSYRVTPVAVEYGGVVRTPPFPLNASTLSQCDPTSRMRVISCGSHFDTLIIDGVVACVYSGVEATMERVVETVPDARLVVFVTPRRCCGIASARRAAYGPVPR